MVFGFKSIHQGGYGKIDPHSERTSSDDGASSSETLLGNEKPASRHVTRRPWWRSSFLIVLAHVVLFAVYAASVFVLVSNNRDLHVHGPNLVNSPASDAVLYEERALVLESRIREMPFASRPSPELDANWHELLKYTNIEVEPDYMRHFNREDIGLRLPDKDRYVGTLNVYHQLHCVKRLHQYMYPDYYYPNQTEQQKEMNRLHSEHCIDFLRQSLMCLGDVGLITFEWSSSSLIPVANATTHQCVNWDSLRDWTGKRAVDMQKPGYLIHPKFGPAYPETGGSDGLGVADPKHPYDPKKAGQGSKKDGHGMKHGHDSKRAI